MILFLSICLLALLALLAAQIATVAHAARHVGIVAAVQWLRSRNEFGFEEKMMELHQAASEAKR
jgi:hypothetical protein